jgi:hypothetical protein
MRSFNKAVAAVFITVSTIFFFFILFVQAAEIDDGRVNAGDAIVTVEAPWTQTSLLAEAAESLAQFNPENFWTALDMGSSSTVNASSQLAEATAAIQLFPVIIQDSEQQRLSRSFLASRTFSPSIEAQYKESAAILSSLIEKAIAAMGGKEKTKAARKSCGIAEGQEHAWIVSKPTVALEFSSFRAILCDAKALELFFKNREQFIKNYIFAPTTSENESPVLFFEEKSNELQFIPFTSRPMKDSQMRAKSSSSVTKVVLRFPLSNDRSRLLLHQPKEQETSKNSSFSSGLRCHYGYQIN